MKNTVKNPFRALVEFRNAGFDVVLAKVTTSLRLCRVDSIVLSDFIMTRLVPKGIRCHMLYDGSFVVVKDVSDQCLSNTFIAREDRALDSLELFVELDDGKIHAINVTLNQSASSRCDYTVQDVRTIELRGEVSIEVEVGDDTVEE